MTISKEFTEQLTSGKITNELLAECLFSLDRRIENKEKALRRDQESSSKYSWASYKKNRINIEELQELKSYFLHNIVSPSYICKVNRLTDPIITCRGGCRDYYQFQQYPKYVDDPCTLCKSKKVKVSILPADYYLVWELPNYVYNERVNGRSIIGCKDLEVKNSHPPKQKVPKEYEILSLITIKRVIATFFTKSL